MIEEAKQLLRQRNLKATQVRLDLIYFLKSYEKATPFKRIQEKFSDTDRVTIYRTLNALMEKGIIHKAHQEQHETYYALCKDGCSENTHDHQHVHFKCKSCEHVSCEELEENISISIPHFQVDKANIFVTGLCETCQGKP